MRYDVLERDDFKCQKCGISAKDGAKLHVDHIIPVSKGGITTLNQLCREYFTTNLTPLRLQYLPASTATVSDGIAQYTTSGFSAFFRYLATFFPQT